MFSLVWLGFACAWSVPWLALVRLVGGLSFWAQVRFFVSLSEMLVDSNTIYYIEGLIKVEQSIN